MRLFIAINPPAAVRDAVYADAAPLRAVTGDVKWVAAPLLHVTLKFLGEQPERLLDPLRGALTAVAARHPAFDVETTDVGAFPNFRSPRVVWLGMTGEQGMRALVADLDTALAPLGIAPERRTFQAHLTLGRVKERLRVADAAMLAKVASGRRPRRAFALRTVDLMRSELTPSGSRYSVLATAPLHARGS
jgi:2'-5' RNA ligase